MMDKARGDEMIETYWGFVGPGDGFLDVMAYLNWISELDEDDAAWLDSMGLIVTSDLAIWPLMTRRSPRAMIRGRGLE